VCCYLVRRLFVVGIAVAGLLAVLGSVGEGIEGVPRAKGALMRLA
jgi:hypothetical protein